jgi:transposase
MRPEAPAVNIDATQLAMLLDGIDFGRVGRPKRWKPPTPIEKSDRA